MKYVIAGLILLALAMAFVLGSHENDALRRANQEVTKWQARYAEEATRALPIADTVIKQVTRVAYKRDTVLSRITDTAFVRQYVYQTDTLRIACEQCAKRLVSLKWTADSTIRVMRDALDRQRPRLRDRVGVFVGYGISGGQDHQARLGLQFGLGVRILP